MRYISILLVLFLIVTLPGMADDNRNLTKVIVKQKVKGTDSDITFASNYQDRTSVMVWTKTNNKKYQSSIYAVYITFKSDKTIKLSKPKLISNSTDYNYEPSIAYNSYNNTYLVVWSSQVESLDTHVLARKLNSKGRPRGGIVKIAADTDARNSSPSVAPYFAPFGPGKEKHRFVIAYSKTWPNWKQNVYNGVCLAYLDENGRYTSSEEQVLDAAIDPNTHEAQELKIGSITSIWGPYYFFTVTKKYYADYDDVSKKPDTFIFQFSDVQDYEAPRKIYSGLYDPAHVLPAANDRVLVSWEDIWNKNEAYVQLFQPGPKKAGKINRPAKRVKTMASRMVNFWNDFYLYNYDGEKTVTVFKIGAKGNGKEKVGTLDLPDYLGQEMLVYWANNQERGIIATNQYGDDPNNNDTELAIYYFDAPDWENQGAGAPPQK